MNIRIGPTFPLAGPKGVAEPSQELRGFVKRQLAAYPKLYTGTKWLEARLRYALSLPHERDFEIFRDLPPSGLFVDSGANIGQSAFSFASVRPGWDIVSFEPNPALARSLARTSRTLGRRHRYTIMGLGAARGTIPFYVPFRNGAEASQEGTFCREQLFESAAQARLGPGWGIRSASVPVERFDALGLFPDIVKIDVQGYEYEVIEGMEGTLRARAPKILYVEAGTQTARVTDLLSSFDYMPSYVVDGHLRPWNGAECLNVIYSRKGSPSK
jgi:FkbM family methyltransferase